MSDAYPPNVDLITLGDELLLGIRENTHLYEIGKALSRHGLRLRRNITCRDIAEEIREVFLSSWESADMVITTGGLGPTSDDNTREVVAEILGLDLVFDPSLEEVIRVRFESLGLRMSSNNLKQCYVPKGAISLPNPFGTAPGIYMRRVSKDDTYQYLFMLPGPRAELMPMLEKEVIPRLCQDGFCVPSNAYLQFRTMGLGESLLDELLAPIFSNHPGVEVAYCAHQGVVDVRLSSLKAPLDEGSVREVAEVCREKLGPDFLGYGDLSLAQIILEDLHARQKTLAVAESCTGGRLAQALTEIPGASKGFRGGVVCYHNQVKTTMLGVSEEILMRYGAVSPETAVALATGAAERLSSDYALAITGVAGPSGGTSKNPVGTFYIGYHSPTGTDWVRKYRPGARLTVQAYSVTQALDLMRRRVRDEPHQI